MATSWSFESGGIQAGSWRSRRPSPGQVFAGYRILEVLGEGTSGVVFRALDSADRHVALKILKATLDETSRARFQREGEVAASLTHSGLSRVLAGGESQGMPFLAFKLVENAEPLDSYLRRVPLAERVRVLHDVAAAVGYAHGEGVVHRDLKPENVLVDGAGQPFVTDFGLARLRDSEREALTKTGAVLGTPATMSPEQLLGEKDRVGPHSDVWSLGVMLYEAICGQLPFEEESWLLLQIAVVERGVKRPSSLKPGLSPHLEAICLKALKKAPEDRYADATGLASDLAAYAAGERPSASTQAGLPLVLRRIGPPVFAAAALATIGLVALALFSGGPEREASPGRRTGSSEGRQGLTPPPQVDPKRGQAAFSELRGLSSPQARIAGARAWLQRYSAHAIRADVEIFLGRLERDHPGYLLKLGEGQAHGRFLDDATLQVVGSGGTVATWDLATGERGDVRRLFSARPGELCSARVGAGLVVGGTTLGLVWDLGGTITREDEREYVSCLSVSRDQRLLAVGFMNRRVVVFDVATRRRVLTTEPHDKRVFSIAFTPDGSKVVACSGVGSYLAIGSNQLRVYRVEGGETLADFDTVSLGRALAVAPSGLGFVGTNTGGVDIWDLGRGRRVFSLHGKAGRDMRSSRAAHAGSLRAVAFSEDGTTVVTLGVGAEEGKNEVIAWDVKTRAPIGAPMVRPTMLFALDISPDGRQMAVGCSGGVVEVWTLPK